MSAWLEIAAPGAWASVQDLGRRGYRRIGIPWAGVLDPTLLRIANALAGNPPDAAAIECFDGGQHFIAREAPLRLAVAGAARLEASGPDGPRRLAAWRSFTLQPGESLRLQRCEDGRLMVVAIGGWMLPPVLGSASTYARAALGGIGGRALAAGDRLGPLPDVHGPERILPSPPLRSRLPIRVVGGPQADHFTPAALATLFSTEYRVSTQADRMGVRLEGQALAHRPEKGAEIVSDATVPGSIQVPGNGMPIVLLADAQTAGGYPKIATVVGADLGRLAGMRPGEALRFQPLAVEAAEALARESASVLGALIGSICRLDGEAGVDLHALQAHNLVSGVVDAHAHPLDADPRS